MEAIQGLLSEVVHEIVAEPVVFAIELAQFAILAFALKIMASRMLGPMLAKRRERIGAELAEAAGAGERIEQARWEAERIVAEARENASARIEQARKDAKVSLQQADAGAKEEEARVMEEARETLRQEQEEAVRLVHAQLVDLVTIATRNVLDEALSENERRELVEKSVLSSLDELEDVALAE